MPLLSIDSAQFQIVPLNRINLQIDSFHITTREDLEDLTISIQHDGLISPPTLIKSSASAYVIVSGFRRVRACQKIGCDDIYARILDSNANHLDCLRLAIAENALQRPLNLIEYSRAIHKLSSFFDNEIAMAAAAETLGLEGNPSVLKKVRGLCLLPRFVQDSILNDAISLSIAVELGKLDPDSAAAYARLFDQLKLSLSKQKEILILVDEIARREESSVWQVLNDPRLQKIISNEDLDRTQKGRQIRAFLRELRFPQISAAEKQYKTHYKKLNLGNDIKLIPPKDFEGATYMLNLSFTSLKGLLELRNKLDRLIVHPSLEKIVDGRDS